MDDASRGALASRLAEALAGPDAEVALSNGVALLAELGLVPRVNAGTAAWLEIAVEGRTLALALAGPPPDEATRRLVTNLLGVGLARAVEADRRRRVQERHDMLSAASFEGIMVHVDGVVIDANDRLSEMLGYEPHEVLGGMILRRCVAEEDLPTVQRRMATGAEGAYVITAIRKDGSRFRAELLVKQGKLGDRPVRIAAVRDVTERERTHALLHESEGRLQELAAATFDLTVLSRDGIVVDALGRVEETIGFTREQVVGRPLFDFVAPSAIPMTQQVLAEGRLGAYPSVLLAASGEVVPVEIVAVMSTLHGEPIRVGAIRDLRAARREEAERRKLEQQLSQGQRLESLGVLAGGIAHDFNNLLVGVMGNAELLLSRVTDPFDVESTRSILAAGQRAAALTAQMLAYAGRRELGRREPVDLGAILHELRSLLAAALSKKARLDISAEPGLVVVGERATLTQVLMNLLTNASDSLGGRPGLIEVRLSRIAQPDARWAHALGATVGPGDWALVEVKDTGAGMDAETASRAFEPFFTTKQQGHGLGLAASLGIVSSHGGAILVESEVGAGSTFSILLPRVATESQRPPKPPPSRAPAMGRVLVVDDEALVRRNLRRVLEVQGYTVAEAPDGASALSSVEQATPDLIVLDITMPDMDGGEVLRRLRASGSTVPVVLSSGYMEAALERGLERSSFQAFLEKPYGVSELLDVVERVLAAARR